MLPFKRPRQETAKSSMDAAASEPEDLLAQQEAEEFAASVRAAQERARSRVRPGLPTGGPEREPIALQDEIVWSEQNDVYRPAAADALEKMRSLGAAEPIAMKRGESLVLIHKAAFQTAQRHVRVDTTVELGGLLIGRAFYDRGRDLYLTLVETALAAHGGDATATSFTYTAASWQALMPDWVQTIGDGTIVGSYHSHPGLGVFLSSTDIETQHSIFPHDWQIALVLDPIANTEGFFIGASGRPCRAALY